MTNLKTTASKTITGSSDDLKLKQIRMKQTILGGNNRGGGDQSQNNDLEDHYRQQWWPQIETNSDETILGSDDLKTNGLRNNFGLLCFTQRLDRLSQNNDF